MRPLGLILLLFALAAVTAGQPDACSIASIIERARAAAGGEEALDKLVTLQMEGRVESARPLQPEVNIRFTLRRPNEYRSTIRIEDLAEDTIVRGTRGCMVRSSPALNDSRMRPLTQGELGRVSVTVHQWFERFRADTANGGSVRHQGIVDRRGTRCHQLRYAYPGGITVDHFFALDDGRLVSSVNDLGVESVPIGSIRAGDLLFPEKVDYYQNREKLHSVIYTRIEVNKPLPAGIFSIPD